MIRWILIEFSSKSILRTFHCIRHIKAAVCRVTDVTGIFRIYEQTGRRHPGIPAGSIDLLRCHFRETTSFNFKGKKRVQLTSPEYSGGRIFPHQPDDICGSIVLFHLIQSNGGAHTRILIFLSLWSASGGRSNQRPRLVWSMTSFALGLSSDFFHHFWWIRQRNIARRPALLSAASYFPFRRIDPAK